MKTNSVFHEKHNFNSYTRYTCTEDEGFAYLWDEDDLITDIYGIKWDDFFITQPYLRFNTLSNGYREIEAFAILARDKNGLFFNEIRKKRYTDFIERIKQTDTDDLRLLSDMQGLYSFVTDELETQITAIKDIDERLKRVIKVFCYESLKKMTETQSDNALLETFKYVSQRLFSKGLHFASDINELQKRWLPGKELQEHIPEEMLRSLKNAIRLLVPEKQTLLSSCVPLLEKLIHLDTLKFFALRDEPLTDTKDETPVKLGDARSKAVENAIYGKQFQHHAKLYLSNYARLHEEKPRIKNVDANKIILLKHPEIQVSAKTLDTWIKNYKSELNRLMPS